MSGDGENQTWLGFTTEPLPPAREVPKPLPSVAAERYCIERLLGVGGMAAVYAVRDLLGEQYDPACPHLALKTLSSQCSDHPDAELLLYTEFALLRRLHHPNVVRIYTLERDRRSGRVFLLLELLEGPTLAHWIAENPTGGHCNRTHEISRQLIDAVRYCHSLSIVHGDLKPANVVLSQQGVKVLDFGLGHASDGVLPALRRTDFAAWTPGYVAPEVIAGGPTSVSSDIYALACILTELYGGRVHEKSVTPWPATPWLRQPNLPRKCLKALRLALSANPQLRSQNTSSLAAAFCSLGRSWRLA